MELAAYRVEAGDVAADRERILALWQRCGFGGSPEDNAARYDWLYLQNPQGPGRVYLLHAPGSDELAGAVGVGARLFRSGSDAGLIPSGTLVDFVVHPAHRSLYPALLLQRTTCDLEFRRCAFLYGIPIEKAVPVVKRLTGASRFVSGSYVRMIRSAPFVRKRLGWLPATLTTMVSTCTDLLLRATLVSSTLMSVRVRCRSIDGKFPDVEDCLAQIARSGATIGDRSQEILAWRARASGCRFETMVFEDRRGGAVIGYAICISKHDDLTVVDFVVPRDDRQARGCWLALTRRALERGAAAVRVDFGGCEQVIASLRGSGFLLRGSRPGFVILRGESDGTLKGNWWFTRFDEDV